MTIVSYHHQHKADKLFSLRIALWLTAIGMVIEFAGGFLSNSLALTSDAWHMLTHLFALAMSYFAIVLSSQPATKKRTYGLYRAEILAAFVNGIVLVFITGYIVYEAISRLIHPQKINIQEMFIIASLGLVINGISAYLLARVSACDLNIRSALLHELGDIASSIAVVMGSLIIYFNNYYFIDPILSFLICFLIVIWAVKLVVESANILLESTPKHLDIDEVARTIKNEIPLVREMHHVHAWTIASSIYALTAQVVIEDCRVSKTEEILVKINGLLKEKFHIGHTNIQFECRI